MDRHYERTGPIGFNAICRNEVLTKSSSSRPDYIKLGSVEIGNGTANSCSVGWGYLVPTYLWGAGLWDDSNDAANAASPAYNNDTTDAQSTTANDFPISTANVANDGFCIESNVKFNMVGMLVGVETTGAPAYDYAYWNGTAWTNLSPYMISTPDFGNASATDGTYFGFLSPYDWAALGATDDPAANEGMSAGRYAVRVRATTAPTQACLVNQCWVVKLIDYVADVASEKSVTLNVQGEYNIPHKTSLVPYCSEANSLNWVNIEFRYGG